MLHYPTDANGYSDDYNSWRLFAHRNIETGVTDITLPSNHPARYFSLDGTQTDTPETGKIYIVVRDGKATKIKF